MVDKSSDTRTQNKSSAPILDSQLDPNRQPTRRVPVWTVIVLLLVLGVISSIGLGILRHGGSLNQLGQTLKVINSRDSVVLVESQGDIIIMTVERGQYRELRVVNTTSGTIEDVSRGTRSIKSPALSHYGKLIAYFILDNQMTELVIAQIGGNADTLVSNDQFSELGKQQSMEDLHICEWSETWWSEGDGHLAFFGCSDKNSLIIVQSSSGGDPLPLSATKVESDSPRTLVWLSDTILAYVQPEKDIDKVWTIDISTSQKQQIFGP